MLTPEGVRLLSPGRLGTLAIRMSCFAMWPNCAEWPCLIEPLMELFLAELGLDELAERVEATLSELPVCLCADDGLFTGCTDV